MLRGKLEQEAQNKLKDGNKKNMDKDKSRFMIQNTEKSRLNKSGS